jgi:hypothetical protein
MQDISTEIKIMKVTRQNVMNLIKTYSLEQLNRIPEGFGNNLLWNFGHIIVTQQLLCNGLSNLPMYTNNEMVASYRKGSKPELKINKGELTEMIELAQQNIERLESDYAQGRFQEYKTYTTSYNLTLTNIEEAIQFNNVHEAMHFGTCLAIKKFL